MEKDDEISGTTGAHLTALFWEYDSRIGRRWNVDPVVKPWESSYACFNGNPIYFIDPLGLEGDPWYKRLKNWIKGDGSINKAKAYQAKYGGKVSPWTGKDGRTYASVDAGTNGGVTAKVFGPSGLSIGGGRGSNSSSSSTFSLMWSSVNSEHYSGGYYGWKRSELNKYGDIVFQTSLTLATMGSSSFATWSVRNASKAIAEWTLSKGLINAAVDATGQYIYNGCSLGDINISSSIGALSPLPFTGPLFGSSLHFTVNQGLQESYFFGNKPVLSVISETFINGAFNSTGNQFSSKPTLFEHGTGAMMNSSVATPISNLLSNDKK